MRLVIAIATYRRNPGLARALAGMAALRIPGGVLASVLVVDNNPDGRARPVVEERMPDFPLPLRYAHEAERGISFARNRALTEAGDAEFLAFVDDDEVPDPEWLVRILEIQRQFDAPVVTGPSVPVFEDSAPAWIVQGGFLEPRRWSDGAQVETAYTGNVLIRLDEVSRINLRFDEKLALIGGEDIQFFDRLRRAGATIRWADGAVIREHIAPARTNLRWLLKRWFRTGCSDAIVHLDRHPGATGRMAVVVKGVIRVTLGSCALCAVAALAGLGAPHNIVARMYTPARGLGMIASAMDLNYREYG